MKDAILKKASTAKPVGLGHVLLKGTSLIFLMLLATLGFSQTISGTITDESNEPVIGANIIVEGTTIGTTTDVDGNFSLKVPEGKNTIKVGYIGMKEQLINIDGRTTINLQMETDAELIDEVVVIGYGVQKRSDLTGSVTSIKSKDIKSLVAGNATAVLQGKMAGVQVESFGGKPGGQTNVFIRGVSSFTNSYPLYVIDGTFADNMNFLNTKDIESIEVLKDAASSAIYGSRAANGVVIITTKNGSTNANNKSNVSVDLRTGFETPSNLLDLMSASEFVNFRNQLSVNDGVDMTLDANELPSTNWQDLSLSNGPIQNLGLSVSGGSENASYYLSGNYFNQDGILVGSGFNALNGRVNSRFKLGRLTINQSLSMQESNLEQNRWFGYDGATAPILAENKPENEGGFEAPEAEVHGFGGSNKYAQAAIEDNNVNAFNLFGNVNFQYDITDDFNVKLNFGADKVNRLTSIFVPTYFMSATDAVFNTNPKNSLINLNDNYLLSLFEPTLNYNTTFGSSNLSAVVGYTRQKITDANNGVWVRNTPANSIAVVGAAPANEVAGLSGFEDISGLQSLFGRVNFNINDRYLLQATLRRDASSKFPEGNRVGVFPSISAGWNIHNEDFFNNDGIISRLKLRAGYGTLGSENIGAYAFTPLIGLNSGITFGSGSQTGFAQTTFVDSDLQWEVAQTINIGADIGLLANQLLLSAEYYVKNSNNVLVPVAVPSTAGTSNPIIRNAGDIQNSGFELEALYRKKGVGQGFNWELGANLGTFNSQVVALPNPLLGPAVTEDLTTVNRFIEGETPGVFWGFETAGVYANQAAIDSDPNIANDEVRKGLVQPGDLIRKDQNGDGIVNDEDNVILGDPTPDFTYGLNFSGNYNAIDFGIFLNGVQGNEIYNNAKFFNTLWADGNKLTLMNNAWTPENTNTDIPRATATDAGGNRAPSDFFVEDGSYLRLRSIELGYTLGSGKVADWLGDLRIFVTGQNLITLTGYSGYDPDVSSAAGDRTSFGFGSPVANVNPLLSRGIDVRAYPNTRIFLVGIQANF